MDWSAELAIKIVAVLFSPDSGAEPGSDQEAEEVLADHLLCLITRDYLELLSENCLPF